MSLQRKFPIMEYKTAEAYNNYIKRRPGEDEKENQHNQELNDLVALAYQNATVNDYPQEMIDYQLEQVTSYYKSYADQYGMEYADFLKQQVGMTEEEFVKQNDRNRKTEPWPGNGTACDCRDRRR